MVDLRGRLGVEERAPRDSERGCHASWHPPGKQLAEYFMVTRLLGQLSEGPKSWVKNTGADGIIHGVVKACGARTGCCAHSKPNLANVPKVGKPYGAECRALFGPTRTGWVQVGIDASGVQLRMLAHRLAYFDGGAFGETLLKGDPHAALQAITGLYYRDFQKTLTYAFLIGARGPKLGATIGEDWRRAHAEGKTDKPAPTSKKVLARLGEQAREKLLAQVPGLQKLIDACEKAHERGWVRTLDGRVVVCNSKHGVLNDVLQGDEAVLMRHAKVLLWEWFNERGWRHGVDYAWMLDVHDEWQLECPEQNARYLGDLAALCITDAGVKLGCRVPMAGEFKVGNNWMECH